jgi:hypothetical protein
VEDFEEDAGHGVTAADSHFVDPSRRWALALDGGNHAFADGAELDLL